MKIVQIGVVAVLLAAAVAYAGVGRPGSAHGSAPPATHGVTVTGTASVSSVPDRASFSFGVGTNGVTARQASVENARKAREVIAALLGAGVAKADLQTQDVTVGPSWNDEGRPDGFTAHAVSAAASLAWNRDDALQDMLVRKVFRRDIRRPQHYVPTAEGFAAAVRAGLGWGMFPDSLAAPYRADGPFVRISDVHLDVPLFWQCWKLDSPMVKAITDVVVAAAADLRRR